MAQRHQMEQADADAFVRAFCELVAEALRTDSYVKIKGLGTFKLIDVESRESIHVNTGERIEIQGFKKVSFTPDSSLRDCINKPFSQFETVVLKDSVHFGDMDEKEEEPAPTPVADEAPQDAGAAPEEPMATPAPEEPSGAERTAEEPIVEDTPAGSSPAGPSPVELSPVDPSPIEPSPAELSPIDSSPIDLPAAEEGKKEKTETIVGRKNTTPWCMVAALLLVGVLIGGGIAWVVLGGRRYIPEALLRQWDSVPQAVVPADTVAKKDTAEDTVAVRGGMVAADSSCTADTVVPVAPAMPVAKLPDSIKYRFQGTLATHTIRRGESLVRVALKYYGNKKLWPYLVDYNRDHLKHPDTVPVGTVIKVPRLVPRQSEH